MLRSFNTPWAPKEAARPILLTNASLVDVKAGAVVPNTSILLSDGQITRVSQSGPIDNVPAEALVVDLKGKFVCPGLIDCHVHVTATPGSLNISALYEKQPSTVIYGAAFVLRKMLLRGFTTIRDVGGCDAGVRRAVDEGLIHGPRMLIAGKALSQTGGHVDFRQAHQGDAHKCCGDVPSLGRVCDGVPACLEATRDELRKGADFIKIMCGGGLATPTDPLHMMQFTPEEIRAITTTATYFGTYVTAHAYTSQSIRHAVDNGVQAIEHANLIDADTAKYCADKGVIFTPTLITYHSWTVPPFDTALPPASVDKLNAILQRGQDSLRILKDADALVCYGSDLLAGAHEMQSEGFDLMAKVYTPAEVLQSATVNASKLLRMEGKIGVVQDGALADLLILDQNPLDDIKVLEKSESMLSIIKEGRVVASRLPEMAIDAHYDAIQNA